jgi:hypothetical protein
MRIPNKMTCLWVASFMTITPYTPQQFLVLAREHISVADKISILKRLASSFPLDSSAKAARENLVALLIGSNRFEDALREYRKDHPDTGAGQAIDFRLLELLLRTGRYNEVLRATVAAGGPVKDCWRDLMILEIRAQALLAKGRFELAREEVDRWLERYEAEGVPGGRFENDIRSMRFLRRHLRSLERLDGAEGKPLFTASIPDSLQHWSHRRDVPIVFFKLIPAHAGGQMRETLLPGRLQGEKDFAARVDELNRGFAYLSGERFSLQFSGLHTLYVNEGDLDPESSGGHLLTSRVYVHTIPQLYKLAGQAYVVLVDYREPTADEAAYMGDGLIHLSATKLQPLILMHEILHGLGATHQDWNTLEAKGFKFDREDRGIMTFEQGEIRTLGLEEKNRALLGWPRVGTVRPNFDADIQLARVPEPAQRNVAPAVETPTFRLPSSAELLPSL